MSSCDKIFPYQTSVLLIYTLSVCLHLSATTRKWYYHIQLL